MLREARFPLVSATLCGAAALAALAALAAVFSIMHVGQPRAIAQESQSGRASEARVISVVGEGTIDAPPNAFVLSIGIHARDKDIEKARGEVASRSAAVIAAARSFPIDPSRTFTSNFTIYPQYTSDSADIVRAGRDGRAHGRG
jgi:uncharacterized protein YggE